MAVCSARAARVSTSRFSVSVVCGGDGANVGEVKAASLRFAESVAQAECIGRGFSGVGMYPIGGPWLVEGGPEGVFVSALGCAF